MILHASVTKLGTMTLPAFGVEFTVSDDTAYMTYSGYTCGTSSTCGALFTQQIVKA